jgi:hypothetical protein
MSHRVRVRGRTQVGTSLNHLLNSLGFVSSNSATSLDYLIQNQSEFLQLRAAPTPDGAPVTIMSPEHDQLIGQRHESVRSSIQST